MIDVEKTIISQYDSSGGKKSRAINNIINFTNTYLDPTNDINNIYNIIWNIETASGFGLDILGRIVGVSREVYYQQEEFFGFSDALGHNKIHPFNQRPFYTRGFTGGSVLLTDDAYRKLIFIKAMSNISDLTAESVNKMLLYIFDNKKCYVNDIGKMEIRYVFEFSLNYYEYFLVSSTNVLPRPAGVNVSIFVGNKVFGFAPHSQPFNQGTFSSKGNIYVAI